MKKTVVIFSFERYSRDFAILCCFNKNTLSININFPGLEVPDNTITHTRPG